MKKNNLYIYILLLLSIGIISCKKNYLDITPTDRVADVAILSDSSLFEDYVINRYLSIKYQDKEGQNTLPGFGRGFEYALWSSLTDESLYNNDDNTWIIQRGGLAPENTGIAGSVWARSYRAIRDINWALNNIGSVNMSEAHRQILIAELHFQRGFRYQDLVRNYGTVLLVGDTILNLDDNFSDPSLYKRQSILDGVTYAVNELELAANGLPTNNNSSNWGLGRATKGAALALKSRLLLYAASPLYAVGSWSDAAAAAKAVMDLNIYSIDQNGYEQLFKNSASSEIIFERLYAPLANHVELERANGPNSYGGWGGNVPMQNLVDAYEMNNGLSITDASSGYDASNPYKNRDPRFYATILYNGAPYRGDTIWTYTPGGKDSKDGPSNWNTSISGYYLKKYMDDNVSIVSPSTNSGLQPWIYMRYAEILLNYAEAQNEAVGPDASVYSAINQIRTRAGMPSLTSGLSQSQMRDAIRYERQVELAFEEHRFYDVRRWKIAETTENVPAYGITITKNSNGSFTYTKKTALDGRKFLVQNYWLPIPRAEMLAANGMLEQSPNY